MKARLNSITVVELARSLRSTMASALPEGVHYMLVVTDFEHIGVDGNLTPENMAQACLQVLRHASEAEES